MNILHISPYYPDLDTNHAGGVCMGKEIETLRKWNQVYVLTFVASEFDRKLKREREGDHRYHSVTINQWTRLFHVMAEPWMPAYFAARSSLRFAWKLIWAVKKYKIDAVYGEYASMGQYLWIKRLYPHLRFSIVEHDMTAQSYERKLKDSKGWRKVYIRHQLRLILKKEGEYCGKADLVFAFNRKDQRLIEERYGRKDCQVLNTYLGIEDELIEGNLEWENKEYGNICFLGQMGRPENHQAAMRLISIAGKVKKRIPELQVYIIGNQPLEELKNLENDYIHVTGFVDDVDEYLKRAALAVFPLQQGAGIKVKVLRSLAVGTPVVTSGVGAEGIDEDGQVIMLAETDEEFGERIEEYFSDPGAMEEKARKSREYIKKYFGWKVSERVLKEVYGN